MTLREGDVVRIVRRLEVRDLRRWVRAGWVRPARDGAEMRFDEVDVARLRLILDLRDEMDLPTKAIPTILSLIDQLHGLRGELRALVQVIDAQPADVRAAIQRAYVARTRGGGTPDT